MMEALEYLIFGAVVGVLSFAICLYASHERAEACYEATQRAECWGIRSSFWEQR